MVKGVSGCEELSETADIGVLWTVLYSVGDIEYHLEMHVKL